MSGLFNKKQPTLGHSFLIKTKVLKVEVFIVLVSGIVEWTQPKVAGSPPSPRR